MKNFIFVALPLDGHLRPALNVAAALLRRVACPDGAGHCGSVSFAALSRDRCKVEMAGLDFVDLGDFSLEDDDQFELLKRGSLGSGEEGLVKSIKLFTFCGAKMYSPLVKAIQNINADVIVTDFATMAGYDAAEALGIPLAVLHQVPLSLALLLSGNNRYNYPDNIPLELGSGGVLLQPELLSAAQRAINPLLKRLVGWKWQGVTAPRRAAARRSVGMSGPAPPVALGAGKGVTRLVNIVSGVMDMEVDRQLPPGWHMSGPQNLTYSEGRFPLELEDGPIRDFLDQAQGEPVVYVATGTLVKLNHNQAKAVADALQSVDGTRFIWSLPKDCHELLPGGFLTSTQQSSSRVMVVPWAPQQALLSQPQVKLFVTHGGLNSLYEGLSAGKPLVVMPFFGDQPVNGQHVVNKRLGATVNPWRLTAGKLASTIRAQLADEETTGRARELGVRLRTARGAERAAEILGEFACYQGP